jgi:ketosteroid isomerase-like protein
LRNLRDASEQDDIRRADVARMAAVLIGDPEPEFVALEARLRRAQLDADVDTLDALISERLLFTGPDGEIATKAQDLAAHGAGTVRFRAHEPRELRVRRVGTDVAVTALRARLEVEVAGELVTGDVRYTRVWARGDDGAWRVVGGHVSLVPATNAGSPS